TYTMMKKLSIFFLLMVLVLTAQAQKPNNVNKGNLAVQGYDVVAYFQNSVQEGDAALASEHQGVRYLFSSAENQMLFDQNPAKYAPQYGGWCAYAMGKSGDFVKVNPEAYKVLEGKLYLFYKTKKVNTLMLWNEDEQLLKQKADKHWQSK
ncbi:MAG: YHS domain-containing (seleno)protein, partial [Bacteroidota bacterium]